MRAMRARLSLAVVRGFEIDVAPVRLDGALNEAGGDRPGLDQHHMDAACLQLHAERVGQCLDGDFEAQ